MLYNGKLKKFSNAPLSFDKKSLKFYVPGLIFLIFYLLIDFSGNKMTGLMRLIANLVIYLFIYLGSYTWAKMENQKNCRKIRKTTFFLGLLLYLSMLLKMTLFDAGYGRQITVFFLSSLNAQQEYLSHSVNLIPFRTIAIYFSDDMEFKYFLINIIGNICAFMPFAFFIPLFLERARKISYFFLIFTGVIWFVELMQLFFMSGNLDIDDYLLNLVGGMLLFLLLKIPVIRKLVEKLTVIKEN